MMMIGINGNTFLGTMVASTCITFSIFVDNWTLVTMLFLLGVSTVKVRLPMRDDMRQRDKNHNVKKSRGFSQVFA